MSRSECLLYKKLSESARSPFKATRNSVGFDLHSPKTYELAPNSIETIPTDLAFKFPPSTYGRLVIRSSLAKYGLQVLGGVIDPDYRGNVLVILKNCGKNYIVIREGQRFVQIICERAIFPTIKQVSTLDSTERGSKGIGSSGTN